MKTTQMISMVSLAALVILLPFVRVGAQETTAPTSEQQTGTRTKDDAANPIEWRVLAPENGKPFTDPFAKLTDEQLDHLSYIVRVRKLVAENKIDADGIDAKEAAKQARNLKKEGVDISYLLVQRQRVQHARAQQVESLANSVGQSLQDKSVTLNGYVIPTKVDDQGLLVEFFLVPTTAACSHEDPPSRLQAVFVPVKQGIVAPARGTPVRVTGKISAESTTRTTFNGNGQVMIHSAYAMSSPEITVFQPNRKSNKFTKK